MTMRTLFIVFALVFVVGVSAARAERASVAVAKAVSKASVAAVKASGKAVKVAVSTCPGRSAWRGLKWVVKHA